MSDLQALEATATHAGPKCSQAATPLQLAQWDEALAEHPDQSFARYIRTDIRDGFHIGADQAKLSLLPGPGNFPSVYSLVQAHIAKELAEGRLLGPIPEHLAPLCHTSPIGLIPKPNQPGKWRRIVDLSTPPGHSVNDAIAPKVSRMRYTSVLDTAAMIRNLGPGTLMDLQNAYRVLPIHPDDHPLLGISWCNAIFIDTALPFGLRSAPKIFSAFAGYPGNMPLANGRCSGQSHQPLYGKGPPEAK